MLLDFIKGITCDSSVPTLTEQEVKMILNAQLSERVSPQLLVILSDSNYTTIFPDKVSEIYNKTGLKTSEYRPDVFDCENFSQVMLGEVMKSSKSDWSVKYQYAFGIVYGYIPTPHAINWFITPDKYLMFLEPQSGEIFKPKGTKIFFIYA